MLTPASRMAVIVGLAAGMAGGSTMAQAAPPQPRWAVDLKAGWWVPETENWGVYYGDDKSELFAGALQYQLLPQVHVGAEVGYVSEEGGGLLPLNNGTGGHVIIDLYPVHVFATLRGRFWPSQLFIPYVGGGWSRVYYEQRVDAQDDTKGSVDGTHWRAGLQWWLNAVDPVFARAAADYGIDNTYLVLEGMLSDLETDAGVELGGETYSLGVRVEF